MATSNNSATMINTGEGGGGEEEGSGAEQTDNERISAATEQATASTTSKATATATTLTADQIPPATAPEPEQSATTVDAVDNRHHDDNHTATSLSPTAAATTTPQHTADTLLQHPLVAKYGIPAVAALLYLILANPSTLGAWVVGFGARVLGWALGIALGLGWAAHVYDHLDAMNTRQKEQNEAGFQTDAAAPPLPPRRGMSLGVKNSTGRPLLAASPSSNLNNNAFEDDQSYANLMKAAGYPVEKIMRGQVCKTTDSFWHTVNYPFAGGTQALQVMQTLYPALPEPVRRQLTQFIEHIMRDYVSSWYSMIDSTVKYTEERQKRAAAAAAALDPTPVPPPPRRRMVYSMAPHRKAPFMEKLYETITIVFGNLATRVEHVNALELALLQWTKVLASTLKTYRHIRRVRFNKHPNMPLTEMAITKEFLLAGKLHKAVTFGLDVPALLFADAAGKECPVEHSNRDDLDSSLRGDESAILEARLFESGLLQECELDYNRVVAFRMVRALLPRTDFGSPLVSSLVTEIMAGCVLTPLMSCFCPVYLNSWIIAGLGGGNDGGKENASSLGEQASAPPSTDESMPLEPGIEVPAERDNETDNQSSDDPRPQSSFNPLLGTLDELHVASQRTQQSTTHLPEASDAVDAKGLLESSMSDALGQSADLVSQLLHVLIDLQDFMDLSEMRQAREENREGPAVDWDDVGCRAVILRLVLVLEAVLMDGRCSYRFRNESRMLTDADDEDEQDGMDMEDSSDRPVEVTLTQYESTTLSQLLMELTSDIEAFEARVASENTMEAESQHSEKSNDLPETSEPSNPDAYKPTVTEQSTLRTLIAAWLQTGQVYRTMMILMQAHATVLVPYYQSQAFLRSRPRAQEFLKVLKSLDGIEFLVDTMSIMNSPRLEQVLATGENAGDTFVRAPPRPTHSRASSEGGQSTDSFALSSGFMASSLLSTSSTPRHVDFHRNEAFAASLRSERERRNQAWNAIFEGSSDEGVPIICHSVGALDEDVSIHRELHHLARIFFSGTNLISIRDAARRNSADDRSTASPNSSVTSSPVSLLTVEMASARRRIEVPDDDSSFLLRAQPRPLNAVGVHRDQRNHDQSFKCFAGTFEEPALSTEHFSGGRYVRYCYIKYYPIDRTASVSEYRERRRVDQRKTKNAVPDTITLAEASSPQTPVLSGEFLRERHLCQRWVPRGTTRTQSILSSSVMEPTDFTAQPRTGKAMDFVYRLSFFEKPMIELGGKIFTVHDSSSLGTHRADASGLEMSDAALSSTLLSIGEASGRSDIRPVEMGEDGYPILWMKFSRKQDDAEIEVRPYRVSFVRAALLVTGARHEAQLQSLISCVKAGSVRNATKGLTDAKLKPALRLLEYAGTRSREKESLLLRDIKLGVNHIDREQLRRNGLWCPRFPTAIQELFVTVEDCFTADDARSSDLFGSSGVYYQIRVATIVDLVANDEEMEGLVGYRGENGLVARKFREEWTVYRNFKDFQLLHRHLKSQVSTSESSGTAVSRLSASLNSSGTAGRRHRSALIPSLSQASKIGALGLTKKSLQKRKEYLDGYLAYLFAPDHLLNRCPELLLFVGAFYPLPHEVRTGKEVSGIPDPLGRTKMMRSIIHQNEPPPTEAADELTPAAAPPPPPPGRSSRAMSQGSTATVESEEDVQEDENEMSRRSKRKIKMIPAIRNKVDKVPLSQVRNRMFELLRYQFGFENASFVRNRMLAAIKTASFAVTSASEFRRTLYSLHTEHLSAKAVADLIKLGLDLLWPDGVFFQAAPPLTAEEMLQQAQDSKQILHQSFPDALRAVLGSDLTKDGLNVLHEMLQNRLVVKSLFYMWFDLLWLEVFPEIADILQGGAALDVEV